MLSNKNLNPIVTELFIKARNLNIYLLFITKSYFFMPKNIRLNSIDYFIMKIPNKPNLQQIAFNHSSDIDFIDYMNLYKKLYCKTITAKNIRLNSIEYFIMKIRNKPNLQQIAFNHSSDIDFIDYMNLYKKLYCKTITAKNIRLNSI